MTVAPYPQYKDSGTPWLEQLPASWAVGRIKELFEIKKRIAGTLDFDVFSITQSGLKVRDTESNDGQLSMDYSKYQIVRPGDFAMNHMDLLTGWIDISVGTGVTSPDYRVFSLRNNGGSVPRYFLYYFQMAYSQRLFYPFGQGSSQLGRWRLPTDAFNDFPIPVPSKPEQAAIASFLDRETGKIDALVEEQRQLIALLKEQRQAVISHAVTKGLDPNAAMKDSGVEWLGEMPAHWAVAPIKHTIELATSGPRGWSDLIAVEGSLFFQSQNIGRNMDTDFTLGNRIQVPGGPDADRARLQRCDVVVCITGGRTGAVAFISNLAEDAYINQHVCLLRPKADKISGLYLSYGLFGVAGQEQLNLSMYGLKQGLGLEDVRNVFLPLPPIAEQHAITAWLEAYVTSVKKLLDQAGAAVALLQERRAALISAAVTGKIDVRGLVPATAAQEAA